jgi:hypothetical protein
MRTRGRKLERLWTRYAGSVAFVALILIAALGFARIENARYDGCQGGNLLRAGLRDAEAQQIRQTLATNPNLFPNSPPAQFKRLVARSVRQSRKLITVNYADRDCGTKIDLPLTGASIVLPP